MFNFVVVLSKFPLMFWFNFSIVISRLQCSIKGTVKIIGGHLPQAL